MSNSGCEFDMRNLDSIRTNLFFPPLQQGFMFCSILPPFVIFVKILNFPMLNKSRKDNEWIFHYSRSVVFIFSHASQSPGRIVKKQIAVSHPQCLIPQFWYGTKKFYFQQVPRDIVGADSGITLSELQPDTVLTMQFSRFSYFKIILSCNFIFRRQLMSKLYVIPEKCN